MDDPRLQVTAFEAPLRFTYTSQTIAYLRETHPGVHFVWIMGADSLMSFDHWENWETIAASVPMAIYARPGSALRATRSPAATALAEARIPEDEATTLASRPAPAWVYLRGVMSTASSTAIRQARARTAATQ